MLELDNLRKLTEELANEVHKEEHGKVWMMLTMILDNLPLIATILDANEKPIYQNEYMKAQFKKYHGKEITTEFAVSEQIKGNAQNPTIFKDTLRTREIQEGEFFSDKSQINYKVVSIPLIYNGIAGAIMLMYDSTKC